MTEPTPPSWHTPDSARTAFNITVTADELAAAREQCLRIKGLPLTLAAPPSRAFAQGVAYQALANRQATQAGAPADQYGNETSSVALRPFDGKIMALLIVPAPILAADGQTVIGDAGRVRSMIG